jgi:triosephosphate isomerase (TIM)
MRKPMMAGNWKMNKTFGEAQQLARDISAAVQGYDNVDRVICPPFVAIPGVAWAIQGSPLLIGAQNVHWAESGAYTGEISVAMLKEYVSHVIIGHSERRQYFAESDEGVNKKAKVLLAAGITPIICVGETLEQNQAGVTQSFVSGQVKAALDGLTAEQVVKVVIAYEPIWAIGTGLAATSQQAQAICGDVVRAAVAEVYGSEVAEQVVVLYGGSTNEKNITEIMQQPDIDGALIGGAALKVDSYASMVKQTSELYA